MHYFQNERRYGAGNFYKDLFLDHLQSGVDKNSDSPSILMLEFDGVMVNYPIVGVIVKTKDYKVNDINKTAKSKNN